MSWLTERWSFASSRHIEFGTGAVSRAGTLTRRIGQRVLVCTDGNLVATHAWDHLETSLSEAGLRIELFDQGEPEVPRGSIEDCANRFARFCPEVIVGLGGGSNIDLAKLVSLALSQSLPITDFYGESAIGHPLIPVVAISTTAGTGSEVTPVAVLSDPELKRKVGVSNRMLIPAVAIVDPLLTITCPPVVTAASGMDALSHAVEAYLAARPSERRLSNPDNPVFVGKNPISDALALEAVGLISRNLARAVADGTDVESRVALHLGSLMAGMAFASAGTGLVHALQYPIGILTGTSHGLGNALLMPATVKALISKRRAEADRLVDAMVPEQAPVARGEQLPGILASLAATVGMPSGLRAIGVREEHLSNIAESALSAKRLIDNSPIPGDLTTLLTILGEALDPMKQVAR